MLTFRCFEQQSGEFLQFLVDLSNHFGIALLDGFKVLPGLRKLLLEGFYFCSGFGQLVLDGCDLLFGLRETVLDLPYTPSKGA